MNKKQGNINNLMSKNFKVKIKIWLNVKSVEGNLMQVNI